MTQELRRIKHAPQNELELNSMSDTENCYTAPMSRRIATLIGLAVVGLTLTSTACGASGSGTAAGPKGNSCVVNKNHGAKSRIKPQNSGFTCAQIQSILLVLPDTVGTSRLESSAPNQGQVCRIYPPAAYPLEVRCHRGQRHFEVVAISRSAKQQ